MTDWQDRRTSTGYETAAELAKRFNDSNWRGHPEAQGDSVEEGLDTIGWAGQPKINTVTGNLFDGHLRIKRVLGKDPTAQIPVDYYELTPEEEDFALLTLDATTEMAEPIPDKLAALMERTRGLVADKPALGAMLERLKERAGVNGGEPLKDIEPQIDKAKELREKWGVEVGQLWELGKHRLICGDCTDGAVVEKVMGKDKAVMFATDPPYGANAGSIGYTSQRDKIEAITKDDLEGVEMQAFLECVFNACIPHLTKNCAWYLWHPMLTQGYFAAAAAAAAADLIIHRQIIWIKEQFIFGRGDYHWRHELCFYGWRKGNRPEWYGERNQDTVWHIPYGIKRSEVGHPTAKPVALFEKPLKNHTKIGQITLEPFCGSGSQIIACEQLNRQCRAIEIEPKYVAVTLERYQTATGITPTLIK